VKLLDAATATGVGASHPVTWLPGTHAVHGVMGGTVVATAVTLDLEGSLDGVKWVQLVQRIFSAGEITAENALFFVVDKPVAFVRGNLVTLTGGTAPTVTMFYEGPRRAVR